MTASTSSSSRALRWGIALALGLVLAACSKEEAAPTTAPAPPPAQPAGPTAEELAAQEAAKAALANLSVDELRSRGSQALREQRLYAPAGDSAMEYYLALREKSGTPDASTESALIDLMPYAIIAAEQAIGREDFVEAERLRALIEKTDSQAPALPRITDSIARGQASVAERLAQEAARDEQRARDAQAAAQRAAAEAAAAAAAPPPAPAPVETAPEPTPAPVAQPTPTPPPPPVAEPEPAPVATPPPPPRATGPIAIRTPQPSYPRSAIRSGVTGEVTVEITIGTNGSVSNVRVVRAQPRGEFDREVLSTVRNWQFEPMDEPAVITRTFTFRP